ncbi:MAG: diadenylate cyclase, partial [Thermoplasmata archaeon]|nr:diadenylate cyclase [Thermoplasmata archaeon]
MDRNAFIRLCRDTNPDVVILFSPSEELVETASAGLSDMTIIVASPRNPSSRVLMSRNIVYRKISSVPSPGIGILVRVKTFFIAAMGEGLLHPGQRAICFSDNGLGLFLELNTDEMGIPSLAEAVGGRMNLRALEATMEIATEIAREGREGYPAGALFIVGDEQKVLMGSRGLVYNPFPSQASGHMNVTVEEDVKSIKEFALLDGAVVIDADGNALSAGRYVM